MTDPHAPGTPSRRLKGLWLAREFPHPLDTGDRIYTAQLIKSVREAGCELTLVAIPQDGVNRMPDEWGVTCIPVAGGRTPSWRALLSSMPLVAAAHATPAYTRQVQELARQPWDFVVIDQYGMGWAAPFFTQPVDGRKPVLVHVAHDHEASVCRSLARGFQGNPLKKFALRLNAVKAGVLERRIARSVDLLTAITDEDATLFHRDAPGTPSVVLTPGYNGAAYEHRHIDASVPRHVLMVGSYKWMAKEENLRQFVTEADPVFAQANIQLHVIGSMNEGMKEHIRTQCRATVVHGFVDDLEPHMRSARIAAVPEEIGGGFKLKFLDYIFSRVPVATIAHAAAGLPHHIRDSMIQSPDMAALVRDIVAHIDQVEALDQRQNQALAAAVALYRWADRGTSLRDAILARMRHAPQGVQRPATEVRATSS